MKQTDIPSADLGRAIFAAPVDVTQGPVKSEGGWVVFASPRSPPPTPRPLPM
ncbi:hypothetical protein RAA17_18365 [Komagataeibacter rhaeticus]|nr:hypothetical protein [Komagataeibacter rhaeticus]